MLRIHIRAFAQLREVLGCDDLTLDLPPGCTVTDAWSALCVRVPRLQALSTSTRAARNGTIGTFDDNLGDGDEVAFLPPFGGG